MSALSSEVRLFLQKITPAWFKNVLGVKEGIRTIVVFDLDRTLVNISESEVDRGQLDRVCQGMHQLMENSLVHVVIATRCPKETVVPLFSPWDSMIPDHKVVHVLDQNYINSRHGSKANAVEFWIAEHLNQPVNEYDIVVYDNKSIELTDHEWTRKDFKGVYRYFVEDYLFSKDFYACPYSGNGLVNRSPSINHDVHQAIKKISRELLPSKVTTSSLYLQFVYHE